MAFVSPHSDLLVRRFPPAATFTLDRLRRREERVSCPDAEVIGLAFSVSEASGDVDCVRLGPAERPHLPLSERGHRACSRGLGIVAGPGVSVVNVVVRRPGHRTAVAVAAVVLGLLAFAADAIDGFAGRVAIAVVSSGLAWGSAALLAGWTATSRRGAVTRATLLLISATLVYYLLILVVSRRWSGGSLADGSSADGYALRSLAVTTTAWLLISVFAGFVIGLLGRLTRTAPVPGAALAAGAACGLLSGQGWQEVTTAPSWLPWVEGGPDVAFAPGISAAALIQIIIPLAILVWLATVRRLWRAWPLLFLGIIVTATLSALCWHLLRTAANHFG